MKKTILFVLIFSAFAFSKVNAQQMYSDPNFLKCTLQLYTATATFDEAYNSKDNQEAKAQELLPEIQKNVDAANRYFQLLKSKYASENGFKDFEQNVEGMQKACEFVKQGDDKSWIMLYTLVKMQLQDLVNQKIK